MCVKNTDILSANCTKPGVSLWCYICPFSGAADIYKAIIYKAQVENSTSPRYSLSFKVG